jgi:signal peptidase I
MKETVNQLMLFAFMLALIIGGEKLYKSRQTVAILPTDSSMSSADFPAGSYKVDSQIFEASKLKQGDAVGYRIPGEPSQQRIARVAAIEGQSISCDGKNPVKVDGKPLPFQTDPRRIPEFRIPRGCVYVLGDNFSASYDSSYFGPLPSAQVIGRIEK